MAQHRHRRRRVCDGSRRIDGRKRDLPAHRRRRRVSMGCAPSAMAPDHRLAAQRRQQQRPPLRHRRHRRRSVERQPRLHRLRQVQLQQPLGRLLLQRHESRKPPVDAHRPDGPRLRQQRLPLQRRTSRGGPLQPRRRVLRHVQHRGRRRTAQVRLRWILEHDHSGDAGARRCRPRNQLCCARPWWRQRQRRDEGRLQAPLHRDLRRDGRGRRGLCER